MKLRIHFPIGLSTATQDVEVSVTFPKVCDAIERAARGHGTIRFVSSDKSVAINARSIVFVEEIP